MTEREKIIEEWRVLGCTLLQVHAMADKAMHVVKNSNSGHHCDYRAALHSIRDLCEKAIAGYELKDCAFRTALPKVLKRTEVLDRENLLDDS